MFVALVIDRRAECFLRSWGVLWVSEEDPGV